MKRFTIVSEDVALLAPNGGVECHKLAVYIALGYLVGIGNGHMSYSGTHNHLGGVCSDASDADNKNIRTTQNIEFLPSKKELCSLKPICHYLNSNS